ncbi:uncharacterized protein PITG_01178 [Phytophthora infestans T30-4]|uniref:Ubiquitin-like protease family profile domain-containing protein n=2 Tax=Phytophthora infestans TaxID=4787 RepID=D0MUU3_PHYIT|nr:uncharacterized protein PITG_01178 [Phytophthora infestans T30-4]EEY60939.1 conserved hypothetical protein [Phytophthora infestans T30-4]|eukprot:XP_002907856.1 conserved hypothetical protein [Phytophthora infestans T30-4]
MHSRAVKDGNTGVVSPSFVEQREPDRKRKVASAYNAFSQANTDIIDMINFGGAHWLENTIKEVVEPLLPMNAELNYCKFTSCLQEDSDNCGLWCLIVLELTLARTPWHKGLYKLMPYLRLRYLGMCTNYIDQNRDGR